MKRMLLVLAVVAGSATARADDDPKAKAAAEYAEGQRLYGAMDYAAAAAKFKAAWALDADPAYLFNIAQALRFAKQCSEAAEYYKKFLAQVTSAPNLDKVNEYLAEVEACAKTQDTRRPPPPPPPKPTPAPSGSGGALGLAIGGIGIGLVGLGAWFNWDAIMLTDHQNTLTKSCGNPFPCDGAKLKSYETKGPRAMYLGIAFDIAGVAAIAGGILLYMRGPRATEEAPIAITPTRGGAIVGTGWTF